MKLQLTLLLLLLAAASSAAFAFPQFSAELNEEWELFKKSYEKVYAVEEELMRRMVWEQNLQRIQKHNLEFDRGQHSYTLGMNEFADLTFAEFRTQFLSSLRLSNSSSGGSSFLAPENIDALPKQVDWREKGYVTPVKNQQQCGSCWAFSTTGSLEGQHFKKTGKLVSLSEQQLVDCSQKFGNFGCNGGLMDNGFKYIKSNGGIDTEACYSYKAVDGKCHFRRSCVGATVSGFVDIPSKDESALQKAVATVGPISVAIDAGHSSFQLYRSGVYDESLCSETQLDHGVLVVGYGSEAGSDYWLVKNSWGASWGEKGFIMMSRNRKNQCGIATSASYPLV